MAKKTITDLKDEALSALDAFFSAAAEALDGGAVAFTAPTKAEPGSYSRDELEEMDIKSLRDLAKRHNLDTIKKAEIIDALASEEDEDEGEEDEDDEDFEEVEDDEADEDEDSEEEDEDEEADDEGDEYTREELEEMPLRSLRALAKESGYTADDIKGLDQDALIDLMLGEDDEDEDEADEEDEDYDDESEDEGDEEEGDEDGEELTEDDLRAMSLAELKEVASDIEIDVPRGIKKDALIDLILESADE